MNDFLQHCSFHATWNLDEKILKPFSILLTQIEQHIKNETHKPFREEGLLFKSYLFMSGIGGKQSKNKKKALDVLIKAIKLVNDWNESPTKDGFLVVAYALEAWIDMDKTEKRVQDLHRLQKKNSNDTRRKPFEATIHFIKGFSLSRLGNRYIDSIDEFRQAKEMCPDNPEYLFSFALMTSKLYGPNDEVKTNLKKVLEMNPDYLYAKVELANVIFTIDDDTSAAITMLEEVTTTIISSDRVTPEYKKMLGTIMKIHLNINSKVTCEKVKYIYEKADTFGRTSFIAHQRAKLAKKTKDQSGHNDFLLEALELDPYNLSVKLELTIKRLNNQSAVTVDDVIENYDKILHEHENDQLAVVKILWSFGYMLQKKNDVEKAICRYEKAVNTAIQFCQINPCDTSNKIKFIPDIRWPVAESVREMSKIHKHRPNVQNCEIIIKMIKLQYNLRNIYLTRAYCKRALQMALDNGQRYEVCCILAEIAINLSSDLISLEEVNTQTKTLEHLAKDEKAKVNEVEKLKVAQSFKTGILQERMALYQCTDQKAIIGSRTILERYCMAALSGHKGALKRLLSALEILDRGDSLFYETCAYLEVSIQKLGTGCDDEQRTLRSVLQAAVTGDLCNLRKQQLEMENAFINKNDQLVRKIETVIQTSRNKLNSTMHKLQMRYRDPKTVNRKRQHTLDFFIVYSNFDKSETEGKVKKKLQDYKWIDTDEELVEFLVEVQPCTNPKANNWIMAFIEFNNITKHQKEAKQFGTYKVYPEDQGTDYQDKEYCSIDLARTVCNNIAYILDNLNGFTLDF